MRSLSVDSPAKLNLVLRVLGRQRDGTHRLYTLFHRISLRDTLRLTKRKKGIRLVCSHPQVPLKDNLIVRAYTLLKERRPSMGGVGVRLTKRIPVGGGLGGGSSNAASFLIGMNQLYQLRLTRKELFTLGRRLGADVPFFLSGARHAVGTGRGDRIQAVSFKRRLWFLLLTDPKGLSTRAVYQGLTPQERRASLTRVTHDVRMASAFLEKGIPEEAAVFLRNDLERSAGRLRPPLGKRLKNLRELQLGHWQMSGSGPTLYSIFPSRREALRSLRKLRHHPFSGTFFVCHTF